MTELKKWKRRVHFLRSKDDKSRGTRAARLKARPFTSTQMCSALSCAPANALPKSTSPMNTVPWNREKGVSCPVPRATAPAPPEIQTLSDRACPERSRRECPTHTGHHAGFADGNSVIPRTFYLLHQHLLWLLCSISRKELKYPQGINNLALAEFGMGVDIRQSRRQHLRRRWIFGHASRQRWPALPSRACFKL